MKLTTHQRDVKNFIIVWLYNVNFEHISHNILVFHCWLYNKQMPVGKFLPSIQELLWYFGWTEYFLTLFRMGFFGAARGWRGAKRPPLPKTCHTYPTMMKLGTVIPYLKKIQEIYKTRDTPGEFCWHQHFSPEISKFCYIKKYRHRLHFDT